MRAWREARISAQHQGNDGHTDEGGSYSCGEKRQSHILNVI